MQPCLATQVREGISSYKFVDARIAARMERGKAVS
jgi:hypothetical protein